MPAIVLAVGVGDEPTVFTVVPAPDPVCSKELASRGALTLVSIKAVP